MEPRTSPPQSPAAHVWLLRCAVLTGWTHHRLWLLILQHTCCWKSAFCFLKIHLATVCSHSFYYPFLFFRFQFCKTNAYTVVKLPSLFFFDNLRRLSLYFSLEVFCSANSHYTFLDFSSLPEYFKKGTRTARIFFRISFRQLERQNIFSAATKQLPC